MVVPLARGEGGAVQVVAELVRQPRWNGRGGASERSGRPVWCGVERATGGDGDGGGDSKWNGLVSEGC